MICLDTNVVIAALKDESSPVLSRLAQTMRKRVTIGVSALVMFELFFGAAKSAFPERNARRVREFALSALLILPFDAEDGAEAGDIRAYLKRMGTPVGPYDILIAAQARRRDALLVTANTREFARVPGLRIEDWTAA
ncbi:MAG TPA: type II toxin-antitoxin system VapC family toxin [Propylenella sp.]